MTTREVTYGELFGRRGRFTREGRYEEAVEFYNKVLEQDLEERRSRNQKRPYVKFAEMFAVQRVNAEFPPDPEAMAIYMQELEVKEQQRKERDRDNTYKKRKRVERKQEKIDAETAEERRKYVVDNLPEGDDANVEKLPPAIAFAFQNLQRIGDVADRNTWDIQPEDAPDPGSWNMLMYACGATKKDFMSLVCRELLAKQKEEERRAAAEAEAKLKAKTQAAANAGKNPLDRTDIEDEGLAILREMMGEGDE